MRKLVLASLLMVSSSAQAADVREYTYKTYEGVEHRVVDASGYLVRTAGYVSKYKPLPHGYHIKCDLDKSTGLNLGNCIIASAGPLFDADTQGYVPSISEWTAFFTPTVVTTNPSDDGCATTVVVINIASKTLKITTTPDKRPFSAKVCANWPTVTNLVQELRNQPK